MAHSQIRIWHEYPEASLLYRRAAEGIERVAAEAIGRRGSFSIVLAGGSTPQAVYRHLCHIQTNWSAWHIYFGDERCLAVDHPDRNSVMADQAWLGHVAIPSSQIYRIPAQLGAETAASRYSEALDGISEFDLVLLGLGQDGHTASLFPEQEWGGVETFGAALAVHNAPKPPPDRVSLAAWRLSHAAKVWFLVTGKDKADAVRLWRRGEGIPAASISPRNGVDIWLAGV
ncbi:MAG: 6-phosphogluconolactonase [Polaromonas sp.]|uniref:6-phosphogluconolactonase n=1 Tax=Polaromonas sp. TaxID=1869339 RepID=UPI002716D8C4|nr:6-phosphogluconolactonase [Polaromonas sp.]MDP1703817.1 6-phosphogluconolactonase [Sulfurimicrobium sp.]MDO9114463.1 6-phosphogluconolactonase [Polaromonas sp.]MDP2197741.1 6-phosphogluconolactonase [Sulfurimicrobium sp.]MDP3687158.1 6-phosphogluconolactonase [Sulfurimicrobium sp.]MDZ7655074.1 6-phosphogluconolactonase [Sulfurimicrobium sp.]